MLLSLHSSRRAVMMATTTPSCLRPPPDPPPSPCMYALLEALCPIILQEPPDPPDGPLLLVLQTVLSSVVSPSSLAVIVHPTMLLGAAFLYSETTGSTQPGLWLARSVRFCISLAPTPLHADAASDPLIHAVNLFCYASASFIYAVYSSCYDTAFLTFDVISSGHKVLVCCMFNQSELPFNTFCGVCTFLSSLTESDGEQFWVNSVKLLPIQYGNIGSQSLSLNSTIAFFSTSVKHIQRVNAMHLGTQSLFRRMNLSPSGLPYFVPKPKFVTKEIIVPNLVDLVQFMAIESLSSLFLRVHIAQSQSFSHSALEPPFMLFNVKLSQFGLRLLESFISSPLIAEAIAILSALCMAITLEFSTLKVLSNSLTLIRAISSNLQSKEIIQLISSGFAAISIYHFSRSDNLVADDLANRLFKLTSLCNEHHDLSHRFGLISSSLFSNEIFSDKKKRKKDSEKTEVLSAASSVKEVLKTAGIFSIKKEIPILSVI